MEVPCRTEARRRRLALLLMAAAACLPGCLGPTALRTTRMKYNESVRTTNDEQLLMNIVRLRYADSPIFIDLPSITSQFEIQGVTNFLGGYGNQFEGRANLGFGELTARDSPTLSYRPREGKEVARTLLTPLSAELFSVVNAGANIEQLMLLTIDDVNDVGNAPLATAMTPTAPDRNDAFVRGARLPADLRARGATEIQVGYEEVADASDPISENSVKGADLLDAARDDYVFRARGDGKTALAKREKSLVLRVRPDYVDSPEMMELARIFHLRPGLSYYLIKSDLSQDALKLGPRALADDDTIYLNLRSILQMMVFLSKGVCVPAEHVTRGVAPSTPGPDGRPYDWTRITAGQFFVRSQKKRPRDAEIAVYYRDHWFYVPTTDANSRAVLAILEILVSLEESETRTGGPLLTLPVSD